MHLISQGGSCHENFLPFLLTDRLKQLTIPVSFFSFSVVEHEGLQHFAQTMLHIGSKHGSFPVKEILYDRTTLSKTFLPNLYISAEHIDKLRNSLIGAADVAITTHHWTDDMIKNSYQAFTLHYVNNQFELVSTCIAVYEFTDAKTGIAIKAKTSQVLSGILPANFPDSSIVFVTDNASNVKAA